MFPPVTAESSREREKEKAAFQLLKGETWGISFSSVLVVVINHPPFRAPAPRSPLLVNNPPFSAVRCLGLPVKGMSPEPSTGVLPVPPYKPRSYCDNSIVPSSVLTTFCILTKKGSLIG